jgi:RNA polymerase sigma-54 factor
MSMRQHAVQKQIQQQKAVLTPQLIQRFKYYYLSYSDLSSAIKAEAEHNVFIDIQQDDQFVKQSSTSKNDNQLLTRSIADYATDKNSPNLHKYLHNQSSLINVSKDTKKALEALIDALDNRGYITNYAEHKKKIQQTTGLSDYIIDSALNTLQQFEPEGVGARSLEECLLIQVQQLNFESEKLMKTLSETIKNHLKNLADQRYDLISKALSIPEEGVKQIANFIKQNLNPNPGANFSSDTFNQHINPSFEITLKDSQLNITNLEESKRIKFSLSPHYQRLLADPNTDETTKVYLKEKLNKAKELLDHVQDREQKLNTLITFLATEQKFFLEKGYDYLKPLLQKKVSEKTTMPESTISRLLSSKYARTPQGVIPLKLFCPRNFYGKTKQQFLYYIEEILKQNPKLSDQKIAHLLQEQNLKISRRSVTTYRHELGLGASYFSGRFEIPNK